jgi:hypothetical protein
VSPIAVVSAVSVSVRAHATNAATLRKNAKRRITKASSVKDMICSVEPIKD